MKVFTGLNMVTIIYAPNRFENRGRVRKTFDYDREKRLFDYIREESEFPKDYTYMVFIHNGKTRKEKDFFINDSDQIIITPTIEAPVIAFLAAGSFKVSIVNWGLALKAALFNVVKIGFLAFAGYSAFSAITNKPRLPTFNTKGEGLDSNSPTYGWDGINTQRAVGIPIPIVYGEHKIGGNVINEFIWTDGDKNYLNSLLALCEGEIESISNVKINGNPIANFTGYQQTTKMGTNSQTVIPNFEDLHNIQSVSGGQLFYNTPVTYQTIDSDVEAFELKFTMPSGLYSQDQNSGQINSWSVTYKVEYKLTTSGTWIDLGNTTISGKSRSTLRRVFRKDGLTAGRYDIRVTRTTANSDFYNTGDLFWSQVDEIKTDDVTYPNTALMALELLASEQLSGQSPNITCVVKGKKVSVPDVRYSGSAVAWEDYYWDSGTSQFKRFSDNAVCTWDGSTYVNAYSANPIWCMKDLLTNTRYGLGNYIDSSLIDSTAVLALAKHCEERVDDGEGGYEKRYRLDVVIDSFTKALDLITQIMSSFNGFAFYSGGSVSFNIDRQLTPVQVFGMGNIIEGSFIQSYKSIKETPNSIDVTFLDKDKDYENETITITDEESLNSGTPIRKYQLRWFGTRMSQAIRVGRYALKIAKNIRRTISFKTSIDALALQVGDIFDFSHDVPQWGYSGRIGTGSTTTSIVLDRSITIESGKTYKLQVRFDDDTIEEKTVSSGVGSHSTITVSSPFSQAPTAYDIYAFGETDIQTKPFRLIGIERNNEDEITLTGIEYNSAVYDDTAVTIPTTNYSALSIDVPPVTNVVLREKNVILGDGSIGSHVEVSFEKPTQTNYVLKRYDRAKIYLSDNAGASWVDVGETKENFYTISELLRDGQAYRVAVVSISSDGEFTAVNSAPYANITIQGKLLPPDDVTGFEVSQNGDQLTFIWNANTTDLDLARYVIKQGSDWNTGELIGEAVDTTIFNYPVGQIGALQFMIKAVDTSGNESTNFATDTITVTPPPEMNFQKDYDLFGQNLEYKLSDVSIIRDNLYNATYAREVLALDTATTWEELEALGNGWEYNEANNLLNLDSTVVASGSYEMVTPIDLETIFEFKVVVDSDFKNTDGGTVTYQISTSEDGITYSAFANINANITYRARYIKFKILLATTNTAHQLHLYNAVMSIQAPSVTLAWGRDLAITSAAQVVLYGRTFNFPPRILAQIVNGIDGKVIIDNKTTTQFEVTIKDNAGSTLTTAEIDWEAKGY